MRHLWTYSALDIATDGVAASLAERGIAPASASRSTVRTAPTSSSPISVLLKAGAVVVPINLLLNPRRSLHAARLRRAALFFHAAFAEPAAAALADAPACRAAHRHRLRGRRPGLLDCHLHQLVQPKPRPRSPSTPAMTRSSSTPPAPPAAQGRGADPRQSGRQCPSRGRGAGLKPGVDRVLVVLPMFHAFAGTVGILMPLLCRRRPGAGAALRSAGHHPGHRCITPPSFSACRVCTRC
jgi:long-chain acyl-CoA synthetase